MAAGSGRTLPAVAKIPAFLIPGKFGKFGKFDPISRDRAAQSPSLCRYRRPSAPLPGSAAPDFCTIEPCRAEDG